MKTTVKSCTLGVSFILCWGQGFLLCSEGSQKRGRPDNPILLGHILCLKKQQILKDQVASLSQEVEHLKAENEELEKQKELAVTNLLQEKQIAFQYAAIILELQRKNQALGFQNRDLNMQYTEAKMKASTTPSSGRTAKKKKKPSFFVSEQEDWD